MSHRNTLLHLILFLIPLFALSLNAFGAFDMYMQMDGIPGESQEEQHSNWIELLSFSHGVSQAATHDTSASGGGLAQREHHGDFVVTKRLDRATPNLYHFANKGQHIPTVTIELVQSAGDTRYTYMKYKLEDVLITSCQTSGSVTDVIPLEQVSLNYRKITWTYYRYDDMGSLVETVTRTWDRTTRAEF